MHKMITLSFKRSAKSTVRNSRQNMKIVHRRNFIHEHFEVPLAVKMLKLPLQKRILQVGCGIGIALPPLTYLCQPTLLVGIDINEKFLKRAKRRLRIREIYAELFLEDVRRMPFPDAFFDMVIDFGLCYHIRQNDFALLEIARVLTIGGIFVYETRIKQFFSHAIHAFGRKIPWQATPCFKPRRSAIFWSSRVKKDLSSNGKFS
ncbi:MAG: class I SAM-dependent methyltransferase [bacterium]